MAGVVDVLAVAAMFGTSPVGAMCGFVHLGVASVIHSSSLVVVVHAVFHRLVHVVR